MENFFIQNGDMVIRLILAMALGMLIGVERVLVHKEAGMKTHALVSMGASLFIIISELIGVKYISAFGGGAFNPVIIAGSVISGIGFLCAGIIIFQKSRVMGLTTAGGLWVSAGIGMAAGFGLLGIAVVSTILTLFIFIVFAIIEKPIRKISDENPDILGGRE